MISSPRVSTSLLDAPRWYVVTRAKCTCIAELPVCTPAGILTTYETNSRKILGVPPEGAGDPRPESLDFMPGSTSMPDTFVDHDLGVGCAACEDVAQPSPAVIEVDDMGSAGAGGLDGFD